MGERRDPIDVYISSFHQTLFEVFDIERCKEYEYSENDYKKNRDYSWGQSVELIIPYLEPYLSNYLTGLEDCPESISNHFKFLKEVEWFKELSTNENLYGSYPMSSFWLDVQCDLFTRIASELLFRTPKNFSNNYMALYQPFEGKSSSIDGVPITARNWNRFKDNIEYLTPRLKEIPMPPHMFSVFSQNITGIKNKKKKPDIIFKFLTDEDIYNSLAGVDLDTFFKFEKYINSNGIDGARKNIMAANNKPSELLDVLVDSYLERAFGFFLVKFAAMGLIKCNRFHFDKNKLSSFLKQIPDMDDISDIPAFSFHKDRLSDFLKPIKYIKSMEGLVYSRVSLLQKYFYSGIERYDISKGVGYSFEYFAHKLLDNFSKKYFDAYDNDPIKALDNKKDITPFNNLYGDLSTIYDELFKAHISRKKETSIPEIPKGDPLFNHICPIFQRKPQEHWHTIYSFNSLNISEYLNDTKYSEAKALILSEIAKPSVDIPTIHHADILTYSPPYENINLHECQGYCPDIYIYKPKKITIQLGGELSECDGFSPIKNPILFGKLNDKGSEN